MYAAFVGCISLVNAKTGLVQAMNICYVSGNSSNADDILRVLQALNPRRDGLRGGVVGQHFTPPSFRKIYPIHSVILAAPSLLHLHGFFCM
jgi:hypothetical protein